MVKSAGVHYIGLYVPGTRGFYAPSNSCLLPIKTGPSVLPSLRMKISENSELIDMKFVICRSVRKITKSYYRVIEKDGRDLKPL